MRPARRAGPAAFARVRADPPEGREPYLGSVG